jgi:thiamine pyrophosphokinase
MQFCYTYQIRPDYIMGDFDSVDPAVENYYRQQSDVQMIEFQPEKDDTDTEIAIRKAIQLDSEEVVILGAFGGRMDHCIANIQLLKIALDYGVPAYLVDSQNVVSLVYEKTILRKADQYGKYISFLPFTDQVRGISLEGFKYPLDNYTMKKGPAFGVSNEMVSETCIVDMAEGILLMIQSKD